MFRVGDVVILKSGGPKMTVCDEPSEYTSGFTCNWFNDDGELKWATFPFASLVSVSGSIES